MFEFSVNTQSAIDLFEKLEARVTDTEPAMIAIVGEMKNAVEENFEQEGRPKWPKLSEARIRQRKRSGTWPGKILTEFGGLAASMSGRHTRDTAIVGTNKAYAAAQFLGGGKQDLPPRNALSLTPEDVAEAELILLRHLLR